MSDATCSSGISSGTGQAVWAGTTTYSDQLPPGRLCANTCWPTGKTFDTRTERVDDGSAFEAGAGREVFGDPGVVTADIEQIGRVYRTELDLQPPLARPGLGHWLLGYG